MPDIYDRYIQEARFDASNYERGAARVVAADHRMAMSARRRKAEQSRAAMGGMAGSGASGSATGGGMAGFLASGQGFMSDLVSQFQTNALVDTATKAAQVIAKVGTAWYAAMTGAAVASAGFDSLVMSLEAVEGSAEKAQRRLKELKILAKAPGLGFEESVRAYTGLRGAGAGRSFSQDLISEIANLNAMMGGGKEQFDRAMMAVRQIVTKGRLQQEELLQLNEAGLPIQKFLKQRFGTSDTEELAKLGYSSNELLKGILEELKKEPRAKGGRQNIIDNFVDSLKFAVFDIGGGVFDKMGATVEKLTKGLEDMTNLGYFKRVGQNWGGDMAAAFGIRGDDSMTLLERLVFFGDLTSIYLRNLVQNAKMVANVTAAGFKGLIALWTSVLPAPARIGAGIAIDQINKLIGQSGSTLSPYDEAMQRFHQNRHAMIDEASAQGNAEFVNSLSGYVQQFFSSDKQKILANSLARGLIRKAQDEERKEAEPEAPEAASALRQIEANTRKTYEAVQRVFDRSQMVLGGGPIGSMGITEVELSSLTGGRRRGRGGRGTGRVERVVRDLVDELENLLATSYDRNSLYNRRAQG